MGYIMATIFVGMAVYYAFFRRDLPSAMQAAQLAFLSIIIQKLDLIGSRKPAQVEENDPNVAGCFDMPDHSSCQPNIEQETLCKKCGSDLSRGGFCTDETCPYFDRFQHEPYTEG